MNLMDKIVLPGMGLADCLQMDSWLPCWRFSSENGQQVSMIPRTEEEACHLCEVVKVD